MDTSGLYALALALVPYEDAAETIFATARDEADLRRRAAAWREEQGLPPAAAWREEQGLPPAAADPPLPAVHPDDLEHALRRAEPEGLLRTFLDEGESVHRLLAAFRQAPVSADPALLAYADHLLEAFGDRPAAPPIPSEMPTSAAGHAGETLLEPLSERELEVLRLLTSSLSTRQMADKLCISANTLRSHLKSVYAKLDAHSRYEALSRARELKLLA